MRIFHRLPNACFRPPQVLTTVRSLLEERLGNDSALQLFAPEFRLDNLTRLAEGDKVITLARIRAENEEECLVHDAKFIASSSGGAVDGTVLDGLARKRHQLVCTLMHDVLTMLRNASGISEALVTVGPGDAAPSAGSDGLPELPSPPGAAEVVLETWEGGKGRDGTPAPDADAATNPLDKFVAWFQAAASGVPAEGQAVTIATATQGGVPSARVVLLKQVDKRGFVVFTNTLSRKGRELRRNPRAALSVHWTHTTPDRCVRVEGPVEALTAEESDAYFASRSRGSRLGAWASAQSTALTGGREELEALLAEAEARFGPDGDIPRPPHWGGVRVVPTAVEFWSSGASRLHDRLRFERAGPDGGMADAVSARSDADMPGATWTVVRLSP